MSEGGLGLLSERLRIATPANENWTPQLHALAERLAPLSPEQRAAEWKDTMAEFRRRQAACGVGDEQIGRSISRMAEIVANMIIAAESNAADATQPP